MDISSVMSDISSVMRDISTLFVAYVQIFAPTLGNNPNIIFETIQTFTLNVLEYNFE